MIDSPRTLAALNWTTAVALAEIDVSGRLRDANAGFLRLLPERVERQERPDVAPFFLSPEFATLVELSRTAGEPAYDGLLTIGDPAGQLRTLRGVVTRRGRRLRLVAEFNIEELERIGDEVLQLAHDLAEAQRSLLTANHTLRRSEAEVRALSLTDPLTGMANRRKFDEAIAAEFDRARRHGSSFALAMADLDRFKAVNDEFGHDVGDAVLRAFAATIRRAIRRTDLAARLGGEEFIVLMPHTDAGAALQCLDRIRSQFAQETIPGMPRPITASFGVATLLADDTPESLVKRADLALYRSKDEGRDRVTAA